MFSQNSRCKNHGKRYARIHSQQLRFIVHGPKKYAWLFICNRIEREIDTHTLKLWEHWSFQQIFCSRLSSRLPSLIIEYLTTPKGDILFTLFDPLPVATLPMCSKIRLSILRVQSHLTFPSYFYLLYEFDCRKNIYLP